MTLYALLPALQIPRADPLPVAGPTWLFTLLLLMMFFLHILPMNLVLGGTVVAAVARLKGRNTDGGQQYLELSRTLTRVMPAAIAIAITFGVATLLFAQILYGRLLFTSSILLGWYWFLVIPLLVAAYYGAYYSAFKEGPSGRRSLLIAVFSAVLFLLIAFIYSNNMSLMLHPETFLAKYTLQTQGLSLNLGDSTLLPRYLHMVIGALAVTGLFVAVVGLLKRSTGEEFGIWATRYGLLLFAGATSLNLVVGTWFLLSFSREDLLEFIRSQPLGVTALALGIIFGLATLGCAVLALPAKKPTPLIIGSVATLLLTLLSMVLVRDQIRRALIASHYSPTSWIEPQWTLILLFFSLLTAAAAVILWMVRALRKPVRR